MAVNRPNNQTADSAAHDVRTCEKPICRAERNRLRALRGAEGDYLSTEDWAVVDGMQAADAAEDAK